jgi:hypothetical protein
VARNKDLTMFLAHQENVAQANMCEGKECRPPSLGLEKHGVYHA